jgi:hypothetical protein
MLEKSMAKRIAKGGGSPAGASAREGQSEGPGRDTITDSLRQLRMRLKRLYEGRTMRSHRFRYGLLIFDVATLGSVLG